ncbi:metal ABC transporter ATP-binding protein [Neofamilia massiliensis]|uniref:metal ABC transporter ATP-binding protein n=1 Tax=Neofamilia massiliensis TaxID=1673724 RepID=UPI0006BB6598|nr:ATP-binding cassette domain-containing protein [Neofamilia massiliensis]
MNKVLEVENLSFAYNKNLILEDINFSINKGDFVALIGDNGQGKTTLMNLLVGKLKANSGTINFSPGEKLSYVPQLSASTSNNFPITVKEILSLNLSRRRIFPNKKEEDLIDSTLDLIGLRDKKNFVFQDLSGGQKQKVMLGKALISKPSFLLLDEPLIGLDEKSKKSFLKLLIDQSKIHSMTIIMVSHNIEDIKEDINRIFKIDKGRMIEC